MQCSALVCPPLSACWIGGAACLGLGEIGLLLVLHNVSRKSSKKNLRNPDSGPIRIPDFRGCLPYFYQNWVNGSDSDLFCGPEHIIQKSNSSFFAILTFLRNLY